MANEYEALRAGFEFKVALQAIRKIVRSNDTDDKTKMTDIVSVVHSFEEDLEQSERIAERRAIEADEAETRRERIDEMFDGMAEPMTKLVQSVSGTGDRK